MAAQATGRGGDTASDDAIIAAAMKLAAERGWRDLSLVEIAREAGLPLSDVHARFPWKTCILTALSKRADETVMAADDPEAASEPARDRLFDVMMRRFDALQPYREGVARVMHDLPRDPASSAVVLLRTECAMAAMLEAAGLSTDGLRGIARVKALTAICLATLRTWREDDSPDMARTMSALDGYLRRIEGPAAMLDGLRRPRRPEEPATDL